MISCSQPGRDCGICSLLRQPNETEDAYRVRLRAIAGRKDPHQLAPLDSLLAALADGRTHRACDLGRAIGRANGSLYPRLNRAKAAGLIEQVDGGWQLVEAAP